jgi:hypothetical protein
MLKNKTFFFRKTQWFMLVTSAAQEAEIGRTSV